MTTLTFLPDSSPDPDKELPCKGIFFRYTESVYIDSNWHVHCKQSMRFLKRKSCTGCTRCNSLMDDVKERIDYYRMLEMGACHSGDIYELRFGAVHRDWETGAIDSVDIDFVHAESGKKP